MIVERAATPRASFIPAPGTALVVVLPAPFGALKARFIVVKQAFSLQIKAARPTRGVAPSWYEPGLRPEEAVYPGFSVGARSSGPLEILNVRFEM